MQSIQHFQPDGRSFGADMIGRWRRPRYPSPPRSRGFPVLADERSRHQAPKVRCFGNQGVADRRLAGEPAYHQHVLIWMETKKSGSRSADDRRDLKNCFFIQFLCRLMPSTGFVVYPMSPITRHLTQPLPSAIAAAIWRGSDVSHTLGQVITSGWPALDRELPGGGWPCGSLSELLSPQAAALEWRLLGSALSQVVAKGGTILLVGPPKMPYLPGLQHIGVEARHLVWVQAETATERLWAAEQLIQADTQGAILIWLPQARPEQLRRLQSHAQGSRSLLFAIRPEIARYEASPASLRVLARCGLDWTLHVQILKRRGPAHADELSLLSIPGGLDSVLTSRVRKPSDLLASHSGAAHALGRAAITLPSRRLVAAA